MKIFSASKSPSKTDPLENTDTQEGGLNPRRTPVVEEYHPLDLTSIVTGSLGERWQAVLKQTRRVRSRPTEKSVHDLRVAIRRLMAALDILRMVMPKSGTSKLRKELHAHLKSLSALRDTQVQVIEVESLVKEYPDFIRFLKLLKREETIRVKRASKEIVKMDLESMESSLGKIISKTDTYRSIAPMRENSYSILRGMLAKIFIRTTVLRKQIQNADSQKIDLIHELRLVYKRFRYSVEILQPIFPRVSEPLLNRMSEYQRSLGAIHDKAMLISALDSYLKSADVKGASRHNSKARQYSRLRDFLSKNLEEHTNRFLTMMDELDVFWEHLT